ncbi:hypothetical protein [Novosphingobium sp. Leaf2]|uniref:hypothetical protein n=1 Tax=Novosphingobium sp. Leaf2 TaxID=1735670 RepID=UPI0006FA10E2|nr:hypothetical protein [Novosphingobium sp. Leaf2]KQM19334.1 hypothetical protein ASE49_03565 [Novosphingobium sp. Leaf2]
MIGLRVSTALVSALAIAVMTMPFTVQAQAMGDSGAGNAGGSSAGASDAAPGKAERGTRRGGKGRGQGAKRVEVRPYIEIDQIVSAQLSPRSDVLTYTQAAVGVDASISGRNNAVSASVRYEHQFGWGKNAGSGDAISGIVRGYTTLTRGVTVEAGALATQANIQGGTSALPAGALSGNGRTNIYSVYAGPSVATRVGDLDVSANYRAGFTKIDQSDRSRLTSGATDVFDKSVVQSADAQAGFAPGTLLPVGIGTAGSFYQEDISNLDQRVRDMQARGLVTVPVSHSVQVVGALGYEDVEVSSRDAVRDATGLPVIGSNGRYVTDKSVPRQLAYDVSGLIWDVAVMWRPSPRTSLSAHVGRRYGSMSYGGNLAWAPNDRSQLSVTVYDGISGFGGQLNRLIGALPDDFEVVRDPITGDLRGCVATLDGGNCLSGALGSVRSSVFRGRGVTASYSVKLGRLNAGVGAGYDNRKYIAARGTVLAAADGATDENYWLTAFVGGELGRQAGWSASVYANWITSDDLASRDASGYGASASYYRNFAPRLRGTLAIGIDGVNYKTPAIDDLWSASALAGLRYSF